MIEHATFYVVTWLVLLAAFAIGVAVGWWAFAPSKDDTEYLATCKVIRKGIIPTYKGTCSVCGAELEADHSQLPVTCPNSACGNHVLMHRVNPLEEQ